MGINIALFLGKRCRARINIELPVIAGVILPGMRQTEFAIVALEPAHGCV